MVHRIDAKDRVEGIIIERQWGIGVRDFKCYPISLIGTGHAQSGGSDSASLASMPVTRQLTPIGDIPRRSAGATSDFENMMLRSKIKPRKEPIVFLNGGPTVLANVLTECLLTDRLKNAFVKWLYVLSKRSMRTATLSAFRSIECGLMTEVARRPHLDG